MYSPRVCIYHSDTDISYIGQPLLTLCDQVRDDTLPGLGVLLEDKSGRTVVKYVGKEMALKEKERKTKELVEQQKLKEAHKQKLEEAKVHSYSGTSNKGSSEKRTASLERTLWEEDSLSREDPLGRGQPL